MTAFKLRTTAIKLKICIFAFRLSHSTTIHTPLPHTLMPHTFSVMPHVMPLVPPPVRSETPCIIVRYTRGATKVKIPRMTKSAKREQRQTRTPRRSETEAEADRRERAEIQLTASPTATATIVPGDFVVPRPGVTATGLSIITAWYPRGAATGVLWAHDHTPKNLPLPLHGFMARDELLNTPVDPAKSARFGGRSVALLPPLDPVIDGAITSESKVGRYNLWTTVGEAPFLCAFGLPTAVHGNVVAFLGNPKSETSTVRQMLSHALSGSCEGDDDYMRMWSPAVDGIDNCGIVFGDTSILVIRNAHEACTGKLAHYSAKLAEFLTALSPSRLLVFGETEDRCHGMEMGVGKVFLGVKWTEPEVETDEE
jgi:hypothetical protein